MKCRILLTGCGWKDVQDEYGDLLKKGVTCTYYTDEKDPPWHHHTGRSPPQYG